MKKTALTLIGLTLILQLVQCSTASSTKPAAKSSDPAVEACTSGCTATFSKCMQKAGKNESKKAACSSAIVKCSSNCETKAKGYKKPESAGKYQKSPEI